MREGVIGRGGVVVLGAGGVVDLWGEEWDNRGRYEDDEAKRGGNVNFDEEEVDAAADELARTRVNSSR